MESLKVCKHCNQRVLVNDKPIQTISTLDNDVLNDHQLQQTVNQMHKNN